MKELIGSSEAILQIRKVLERISVVDSLIFIQGETGVGKDMLAEIIHYQSKRRDAPFVVFHPSSFSEDLFENELFGHIKGAYTDALFDTKGFAGQAEGGTLYIDEIGESSLNMQAKLLRFIQSKRYQKVGASFEGKADIRFIVSSKHDLRDLVAQGKMREDLYHRLMVIPIYLPPLRDRVEDIALFANDIIQKMDPALVKSLEIEEGFYSALQRQLWSGNVRELENFLHSTIVVNGIVKLDSKAVVLSNSEDSLKFKTLKDAMNDFKKKYIEEVLEACEWNQTKASVVLEIQRTYLARLIKEHNINKIDNVKE